MPSNPLHSLDRARVVVPSLTNVLGKRDGAVYLRVGKQFSVDTNPRYAPEFIPYAMHDPITSETETKLRKVTYCNIYVGDYTYAMGVPIPHWVLANPTDRIGEPAKPYTVGAVEMTANKLFQWMHDYGQRGAAAGAGWRGLSAKAAQSRANDGFPTVAIWASKPGSGESGHMAMVVPGEFSAASGVTIAQAGATCFFGGRYTSGFGAREAFFWTHD